MENQPLLSFSTLNFALTSDVAPIILALSGSGEKWMFPIYEFHEQVLQSKKHKFFIFFSFQIPYKNDQKSNLSHRIFNIIRRA